MTYTVRVEGEALAPPLINGEVNCRTVSNRFAISAPQACHALTPPTYSLTAIRKFQRLTWVRPSNAHNCFERLSAPKRRYQQRAKANATHSH